MKRQLIGQETVTILLMKSLLIVSSPEGAFAQSPPLWGDLESGSYAVGFKIIDERDYSRAYRPKQKYNDGRESEERARSIQTSIWYPARKTTSLSPMTIEACVRSIDGGLDGPRDEREQKRLRAFMALDCGRESLKRDCAL